MEKCLAVANDASSSVDLEAFYAMQSITGYPGEIGLYDECSKVMCPAAVLAGLSSHLP